MANGNQERINRINRTASRYLNPNTDNATTGYKVPNAVSGGSVYATSWMDENKRNSTSTPNRTASRISPSGVASLLTAQSRRWTMGTAAKGGSVG